MSDAIRRSSEQLPPGAARNWVFPYPVPSHAIFLPPPPPPEARFQNDFRLRG